MNILRTAFIMLTALCLAACGDDDEFNTSNLAGTWERIWDKNITDAGTERYTFFPETPTTGRIELYTNDWATGESTTDLNYVVGYTGHMNIFSGKEHDGSSKIVGEYDIHTLTSTKMVWYRTDSDEELARFRKVKPAAE